MQASLIAILLALFTSATNSVAAVNPPPATNPVASFQVTKKINLNSASAEILTNSFKGIGKIRANSIVEYRKTHGNFKKISELENVKGFSKLFIEKNLIELQKIFSIE